MHDGRAVSRVLQQPRQGTLWEQALKVITCCFAGKTRTSVME